MEKKNTWLKYSASLEYKAAIKGWRCWISTKRVESCSKSPDQCPLGTATTIFRAALRNAVLWCYFYPHPGSYSPAFLPSWVVGNLCGRKCSTCCCPFPSPIAFCRGAGRVAQHCNELWVQGGSFREVWIQSAVSWCILKGFFLSLANKLITREGPSFLQMRIKHLMKSNCIPQATFLSKLCADSPDIANVASFRQAYITCVCSMLPNEDSIKEVSKSLYWLFISILQMYLCNTESWSWRVSVAVEFQNIQWFIGDDSNCNSPHRGRWVFPF